MKLSKREKKLFDLATIGSLEVEDAFGKVYLHKDRKILISNMCRKKKARPELFEAIAKYKRELFELAGKAQREAVIKRATDNALQAIEKREILRQLIELCRTEINNRTKNKRSEIIKLIPFFKEIGRAIELDCKISGHFAPTTLKHEGGDNFIEFMKNSFRINNAKIPDVLNESRDK
jgi:hypothetical protein